MPCIGSHKTLRRAGPGDLAAVVALQRAAYAKNRPLLGVEPLPLLADYAKIFADYEVYLAERDGALDGVLILEPRVDDLLIWSVATAPEAQGRGVGNLMLEFAEIRARDLGLPCIRLYTGEQLTGNIAWYRRHGYAHESTEDLGDRVLVNLIKRL
jgi:ribosomal protein S18 acetylase RimI-like enzyme